MLLFILRGLKIQIWGSALTQHLRDLGFIISTGVWGAFLDMCVSVLRGIKKGADLPEREAAVRLAEGQGKHSKEE